MQTAKQPDIAGLANELQARGWRMATAESCTGGLMAVSCTDMAGSSNWFECAFVTYTNDAKQAMLGVPADLLESFGAVSAATVKAMVRGAVANSAAEVAVAASGVAGPGGGTEQDPVGTVWLAWGDADEQVAHCFHFDGDRALVRQQAAATGLVALYDWLRTRS
ncbi:CinA family protein [Parathalassolituus penaei]|uniref:CinA family protein n=1 Tax=Parathalassolituus penaei TaxID=2997323 RepID=A0A9X3EF30_9GAMM|nr:CinA family protein [Parathalassolituus penaei]MCY0965584.1 CinA family protein [Parathalassolituus penaei]